MKWISAKDSSKDYRDEHVAFRIPKGMRLHAMPETRQYAIQRKALSINLTIAEQWMADNTINTLRFAPPLPNRTRELYEQNHRVDQYVGLMVRDRIYRSLLHTDERRLGPSPVYGHDGTLLITVYFFLFPLEKDYADIQIQAEPDMTLEEADKLVTDLQIITRVTPQLPSPTEEATSVESHSATRRVKLGAMRPKDKARLVKSLESLPNDLQYLRDAILAIADEDQDMLGTGGVDTTLAVDAIEQHAASQPGFIATAQAEELERWLKTITTTPGKWAAPIEFVRGVLLGYDMFGGGY